MQLSTSIFEMVSLTISCVNAFPWPSKARLTSQLLLGVASQTNVAAPVLRSIVYIEEEIPQIEAIPYIVCVAESHAKSAINEPSAMLWFPTKVPTPVERSME